MANFKLGPVIGKIGGGGVEIVEQQFSDTNILNATVTLPEGWESGWVIAQARTSSRYGVVSSEIFGWDVPGTPVDVHRVVMLRQGETASLKVGAGSISATATADITMIRTA